MTPQQRHALVRNNLVAYLLGGGLMVLIHEVVHWLVGAALGYRSTMFSYGVTQQPDPGGWHAAITALSADIASLVLRADLVANAVAALEKYAPPIIMIDMGTATTISYISAKRSYEGGLMFPGVRLSLDALSDHTAQLPDISLQHPKSLIGKNTEDCMRSGIVYGTAGMLDGVIDRIRELLPQGETPTIVATGSNAPVIVRYCRNKVLYDKYLLMEGLWDIYQKNH